MKPYFSVIFIAWGILFSQFSFAATDKWKILPLESSLTFTATQNNAPISGKFTRFNGDIIFDPANLSASKVRITVDLASLSTTYDELTDTLVMPEWFNTKAFPKAIFEANKFKNLKPNTYTAEGKLTVKGQTLPVTLTFAQVARDNVKVKIKGQALLKRLAFNIGEGEWASTDEIKDDVKVDFLITAVKE